MSDQGAGQISSPSGTQVASAPTPTPPSVEAPTTKTTEAHSPWVGLVRGEIKKFQNPTQPNPQIVVRVGLGKSFSLPQPNLCSPLRKKMRRKRKMLQRQGIYINKLSISTKLMIYQRVMNLFLSTKLSRSEQKTRKAMMKLGYEPVSGVSQVTLTKPSGMYVIPNPDVFKSPSSETYVIFGELIRAEDLNLINDEANSRGIDEGSSLWPMLGV